MSAVTQDAAEFAESAHDIVGGEQFQEITAEDRIEALAAKRHVARVDGLAVSLGGRKLAPRRALRARGHIRREIDADRGALRVSAHDAAEHFAAAGGDLEHVHAIAKSAG